MAQIKLTIPADNQATKSVQLLNKQIKTLAELLSSITVKNDLTEQINSLSKYCKTLSDTYAILTANCNKQTIADENLSLAKEKTATQTAKTSWELAKEKLTLEKVNTVKIKQALNESKVQKAMQVTTSQVQILEKGYAELLNTINSIERNYKNETFTYVKSQVESWFITVQSLDSELKSGKITQEEYNNQVLRATVLLQRFKTEIASTRAESKNLPGTLQKDIQNLIIRIKSLNTSGKNIKATFTGWKKAIQSVSDHLEANALATKTAKNYQDKLNASIKLNSALTAADEEKTIAANAATDAKEVADEAATHSTETLTTAMESFGIVINIIMLAITAAITVIQKIVQAVNKQNQVEEERTRALQDSAKALTEETNALNDDNDALSENIRLLDIYIKKIKDTTTSNEDRTEALSEIQSIYGDLLNKYGLENDKIMLLTASYDGLNNVLDEYLGKAKDIAAQQAKTAFDKGEEALKDAKTAQARVSTSIQLSGQEYTRRGFIEAGLENLLSDYTRSKGISIYGTVALDFDATEESLRVLEEAKKKLDDRYSSTSGTNQKQAQAAYAEVTKAIATITEALNITAEAQEAYDKAWTQNELLNTELAEYFYAAQGSTQENYDALVKLLDIINSNVEYTDKERKALKALILNELKDYSGKYDVILNAADDWHNDITKVTSKYEDLIATLEELRDLQQESYDWEEKKLEVLEAEKALEDARNQATVRRYNSSTGQWEWQTDEQAIKEAEDNLEKARHDLEEETYDKIIELIEDGVATNEGIEAVLKEVAPYLGKQFAQALRDTIFEQTGVNVAENPNEITSTTTNIDYLDSLFTEAKSDLEKAIEGIQVLEGASGSGISAGRVGDNGQVKWNGKTYYIENAGAISNDDVIARATIGEGGIGLADRTIFAYDDELYGYLDGRIIKLQRRANSYGDSSSKGYKALLEAVTEEYGSYDSGGIVNGLGYMPKATTQTETVNPPDLTAQILSPQSNREWETYARTMGIMFEQAHTFASRPIVERIGGNTDNSVNNSGQVIMNGVAIGSDKRDNSLNEVLRMVGLVNN